MPTKVYQRLQEDQEVARKILIRLTQPGAGSEDTRRVAKKKDLLGLGGNVEVAERVLMDLARARLVTVGKLTRDQEKEVDLEGPAQHETDALVEISHETLIRKWPRLKQWVDENRDSLRVEQRILQVAEEWYSEEKDAGLLLRGARLAEAVDWAHEHDEEFLPRGREFLEASRRRALDEAWKAKGLRIVAAIMALVAIGALGWLAYDQRQRLVTDAIVFNDAAGLMWTRRDNDQNVTWMEADDYCRKLTLVGYSGWRLPTLDQSGTAR